MPASGPSCNVCGADLDEELHDGQMPRVRGHMTRLPELDVPRLPQLGMAPHELEQLLGLS